MHKRFKSQRSPSTHGFTIVELLIVIVVIGILAAIIVVAYSGVQGRAQDSRRLNDMKNIQVALERYKIDHGTYPPVHHNPSDQGGDFERSYRENPGEFLAPLKNYGFSSGVATDPINDSTYTYAYYRYSAASTAVYGCSQEKAFYILGITRTNVSKYAKHPSSPGFSCTNRNWQDQFSWVAGAFE